MQSNTPSEQDSSYAKAGCQQCGAAQRRKHPLDYFMFGLLLATTVFTAIAAIYTRSQSITVDDAEKRQLRAYVGVIPGDLDNFGDRERQHFKFALKNFGPTPGYNLNHQYENNDVRAHRDTIQVPSGDCPDEHDHVTIFPGQELPFHVRGVKASPQQFDLVRDGRQYALVYYGKFCYNDAFGAKRYTYFCFSFSGQSMTARDVGYCEYYNQSN
jgi:hypothetical protein